MYLKPSEILTLLKTPVGKSYLDKHHKQVWDGMYYSTHLLNSRPLLDIGIEQKKIGEARELVKRETGLQFPLVLFTKILSAYPIQSGVFKIEVATDTQIREALMHIVANFCLGTHWPTDSDDVSLPEWFKALEQGFKKMLGDYAAWGT